MRGGCRKPKRCAAKSLQADGSALVWSLPGREKVLTINPPTDAERSSYSVKCSKTANFGVSADGRLAALPTGGRLGLFRTSDGKLLIQTDTIQDIQMNGYGAVAFSNDGKQLAVEYWCKSTSGPGLSYKAACFDAVTGKIKSTSSLEKVTTPAEGISWWGDRYLIVGRNGWRVSRVLDTQKGETVREFEAGTNSRPATSSPDGRLWYFAARSSNSPGSLIAVEAPGEISSPKASFETGKGERWTCTEGGLTTAPRQR
jgi:hypothetical protein